MFLGLDLGTSSLKALIVDGDGAHVASHSEPLTVQRPKAGHSEQDPHTWIAACEAAFLALKAHLSQVEGIGISGHMHGLVLLGEDQQVLRPCILWNDVRAAELARDMDTQPDARSISGSIVFPGFSAPKMAWVRDHEPEVWTKTKTWLFPKDYLALWLTGELGTEPSDASGSALFDGQHNRWSADLQTAFDFDEALFPPLVKNGQARGTVRAQIAQEFGLNPRAVVAGGGGDNACAALGVGVVAQGDALISLGTSGVMLAVSETWSPAPETAVHAFSHVIEGRYIQLGVTLSAMDSLTWLSRIAGQSAETLVGLLPETPQAPNDVLFYPYLSGERTPHNFDTAQGGFLSLSQTHETTDLVAGVLDGIAFSLLDCAAALAAAKAPAQTIKVVGGGARSAHILSVLATLLDTPLLCPDRAHEAAAMGAAQMGRAAALGQSLAALPLPHQPSTVIEPIAALAQPYQQKYERWKQSFKFQRN